MVSFLKFIPIDSEELFNLNVTEPYFFEMIGNSGNKFFSFVFFPKINLLFIYSDNNLNIVSLSKINKPVSVSPFKIF